MSADAGTNVQTGTQRQLLHFTLGPVQDFIGQARRTRDFWAGSFLLSLLSGHAMKALGGDRIVFPETASDPLFKALNGKGGAPYIGSLPNRFKAEVTGIDKDDPGQLCKAAVDKAWTEISEAVWNLLFGKEAPESVRSRRTICREIWDRQVNGFWDMAWVCGPDPTDGSDGRWLDLRKNFRSHMPTTEGGDHCRLMGQYQEISGFDRLRERASQNDFWSSLAKGRGLDLRPDERLCALALIKRFFPIVAEKNGIGEALPFVPGGTIVDTRHWPSVSYIAALPWLKRAAKLPLEKRTALPEAARSHASAGYKGETDTALFGLPKDDLFKLDGHLLHRDAIPGAVTEMTENPAKQSEAQKALLKTLKELARGIGGKGAETYPSEFYAVLRMDGDRIGARLAGNEELVKTGLSAFTAKVADYFSPGGSENNPALGTLIYAGGDDVLALLPVDAAVSAACHIADLYHSAFEGAGAIEAFTISASIVYSHFRNPLSAVLRHSAETLDEIAKEKNGRASLALAVLKPGGIAAEWVCTFEGDGVAALCELGNRNWGSAEDGELAGGFFHGIMRNYQPLFQAQDGTVAQFADEALLDALLRAEMLKQFGGGEARSKTSDILTPMLLKVLRPSSNGVDGKPQEQDGVAFEGGLVVRFLRNERREALL